MERLRTASVSWVIARTSIQVILQNALESLGFQPHAAAANQEFVRGKAGAEGALKKPLTPWPAIFTFRELPCPPSLLLVERISAHLLLSLSKNTYSFFLHPLPSDGSFWFRPCMLRPLAGELSDLLGRAEKPKVELQSILT